MIKLLDDFLNGITQYRLILYILICLLLIALLLSFLGLLPFSAGRLFFSAIFLTAVSYLANKIFAKVFEAQTNLESVYITALILTLIITPARSGLDFIVLATAALLAQVSKYVFAINRKHVFNPAALGAVGVSFAFGGASWWIGNRWMIFFVILGGFLIVRKLQRFSMVLIFLMIYFAIKPQALTANIFLESPLIFFAVVILTEPQTTPPTKKFQIFYGGLAGLLFSYLTPEAALIFSNIFSYIVSPKGKLILKLKERVRIAPDIYDFVFGLKERLSYLPGQYMEWTYAHKNPDSRGVRRYFTLASSPTEDNLRIGVKFYPNGSSFKKSLISADAGRQITASQLAGEFTLPKDSGKKLAFIAGGIGVTPYRSIIKFLLDTGERRDIILLYSAKKESDFVYEEILKFVKTRYVVTEKGQSIDEALIKKEIPDYKDRIFYISGPHSMVEAFKQILKSLGISRIKVDFFPGYV